MTLPDFFRENRKIFVDVLSGQRGERETLPAVSGVLGEILPYPNPGPIWPPITNFQTEKKPVSGSISK
jgi:hypothetical protein